jgi:serine/threonine-protein kinase HipA
MEVKCLCCHNVGSEKEIADGYHTACSRSLFQTARPPKIPFSTPEIAGQARIMVGRMSISGVQPKLSLAHDRTSHVMDVVATGGQYILKPQTERYPALPENENLCMNIASAYGVEVPPHGLVLLSDRKAAYLVKRFDRLEDGSKIEQEDFQQLLQTDDKYSGSYERIANFIKEHSDVPGLDLVNLFERALLFFVLGNGDAHLKNFSLIRKEEVGYQLSPAYDIVSSRLLLPDEREEMCLSLLGKKNRISRDDFTGLSEHFGLTSKQSDNSFSRLNDIQEEIENMIGGSFLEGPLKERFLEIFRMRMERLFG